MRANAFTTGDVTPARTGAIARGPAAWAFFMNWGQQTTTFVVALVLAGLLGPRTYGIVAIAMIYISFVQLSLDQGLAVAIVQRKELDRRHLDSAFWLNMAWAGVLVAVSVAAASWWASVNHTHELAPVIYALSLLIPIQALTIVQQAVLVRGLQFKRLAVRSNVAAIVGGAAGVASALLGAGVWALVCQQLVTAFTALVLLWVVGDWKPRLRFSPAHARELLGFSIQVFAGNLGTWLNRRADTLLVGVFFGPLAVGLYRLADRVLETLLTLGSRPVNLYALPHLSRLQADPDGLRRAVRSCMRLSALATVPLMLVMAACAKQLTDVLGSHWAPATNVLRLLAIVGVTKALIVFEGSVLFAVGRPRIRAFVIWSLAAVSVAAFVGAALVLRGSSTQHEVVGMALSRVALFVAIFMPVTVMVIAHVTGSRTLPLLGELVRPTIAGLAAVGVVAGLDELGVFHGPALLDLIAAAIVASVVCGGVLVTLDRQVRGQIAEAIRKLRARPRRGGPLPAGAPD